MKTWLWAALWLALSTDALAAKQKWPESVESALEASDRATAAATLDAALAGPLSDADRPVVELHAGEQRRLMGDYDAAKAHFQKVAFGGSTWVPAAQLGLVLIDAKSKSGPEIVSGLMAADDAQVLSTQNADRYVLLTADAVAKNDADAARDYTKRALSYGKEDVEHLAWVRAELERIAGGSATPDPDAGKTPLMRAEAAFEAGRLDDARRIATEITASAPGTDDAYVAGYLIKRLDAPAPNPQKIGVLIPLSGQYAAAGEQIKAALEHGYGGASATRQLVFVDQGETVESAVAGLEQLALKDGVIAVVGPLRTDGALEVARAADALRVPLVSLSQTSSLTDAHPYVLQGAVTIPDQVSALLGYAMDARGMKNFAIFAPDSPYGHASADAFTAEATRRGGVVTTAVFYDSKSTNLVDSARDLARVDPTAQAALLQKLRAEAKAKGVDPATVVLPPNLDMDAIFIPDNASRVPFACAGLAYREFPIGDFRPVKGARGIPLLGLSGWNKDSLVAAGNQYTRGAIFVDAWYPDSESAAFDEAYKADTGHSPTAGEAVASDIGKLLAVAAKTDADTRPEFLQAIRSAQITSSASGTTAFDPTTRVATHQLRILTINSKAITPVADAAPAPTP